jgi:cell division protein FtsQ
MLLSRIKKIFSLFSPLNGKKRMNKRGNDYLNKNETDLQAFPVPSRHQSSQYTQRKHRLARFRQLLTAEKRAKHKGYTGAAVRKKSVFKVAGLISVAVSLLLFILVGGGKIILNNLESLPFFHVSGIVISGNEAISQEKLREASGIILHQTSLVGLNCSQVEASLDTVPWVSRALVKRNWPSTVEISIVENVPAALLHSKNSNGNQLHYIDKKGIPFLLVKPGADVDYPVITGLTEISEPLVREKALAEVLVFLNSVSGNNPYLPAQSVSEIHLDQDGEMVVYLVENPFPIFFGNSDIDKKYGRLVQVLKALYKKQKGKGSISQIEYIQMDYLNDKVLVAQSESG